MPPEMENEEDVVDIDVDALFNDEPEETPENNPAPTNDPTPETKAVSKRINEVRAQTERETREAMAKELGYESYNAMKKAKEKKMLEDAGLDEAAVSDVVKKLVDARLADDPRLKKLADIEAAEKNKFVASQLAEINKATGMNFKSLDQLPPETLEVWQKTGNLKQAYFATQGEALLAGKVARAANGSTAHLANPGSAGGSAKQRPLTDEEKAMWRMVMPDITEEELSKKTTDA